MPKVHTQKAGKPYPNIGIEVGQTYYWWKFRYGGKRMSATYPRPSQLTQSKSGEVYAAMEEFEDMSSDPNADLSDLVAAIEQVAETARSVGEEYESADEEMGGHQGVNYERSEYCQAYADELESAASEFDGMAGFGKNEDYESEQDAKDCLLENVQGVELETV